MIDFFTRDITEYFQSSCEHPTSSIVLDIRKDRNVEIKDEWKVQWCRLCGAFRSVKITYTASGATMRSEDDWRHPKARGGK